jgi:hypothetical protein
MKTINERLRDCMERGSLSVSDLELWLGRSRPAVYGWVVYGREPRATIREELLYRTSLLERVIRESKGPLVPHHVNQLHRRQYLKGLLYAVHPRLSSGRTTK